MQKAMRVYHSSDGGNQSKVDKLLEEGWSITMLTGMPCGGNSTWKPGVYIVLEKGGNPSQPVIDPVNQEVKYPEEGD